LEEVAVVQVDHSKKVKVEESQAKKAEEEAVAVDEKETVDEQENTHKWATAVLETRPKKAETKSDEGKQTPEMSKEEYDKLFHQAAEQANDEWANKTFADFQKED